MILGTRAKAPNGKTFQVKLENGRAYVAWGGWSFCGKAGSGAEAIIQAEAFLATKETRR